MGETSLRQVFLYDHSVPTHLDLGAWYESPTRYGGGCNGGRSCSVYWLSNRGSQRGRVEDCRHCGGSAGIGGVLARVIDCYRGFIGMGGRLGFVTISRTDRRRLFNKEAMYGAAKPQAALKITCGCVSMCQETPPSILGSSQSFATAQNPSYSLVGRWNP